MFSIFNKFKEGFKKTAPTLFKAFDKVGQLFAGRKLDAASLEELEEALYTADFGVETANEILEEIKKAFRAEKDFHGKEAARIGAAVLKRVLAEAEGKFQPSQVTHNPEVIALIGVNGSGKTTTAAKLGYLCKQDGFPAVLGACDTFRAAANEQIKSWSERLGLELVSSQHGADSAAVAFDAYSAAVSRERRILILDTAGRLHTKQNLMEELKKIRRVLQKKDANAPHHRWLVLDGSIGSNSIEQARVFHRDFDLTGLIITKLDGTSRGGALVGIYREFKLPIFFVGLGEKEEDLQPFNVDNYVNAIFGIEE
ncbi:MAG: signal recognition particle-docking protein FtsY [Verrucomicrobiota bacterium]|nr:signal recognition particle-docking protein FtsY [Verrucomicrobiota bacterium]